MRTYSKDPAHLCQSLVAIASLIFDTGASPAISGNKDVGEITPPKNQLTLGGMANGLDIEGLGIVHWTFTTAQGQSFVVISQCYYVPKAKVRLISPQRLFRKSVGVIGEFICTEDSCRLEFENHPTLNVEYDTRNSLPVAYGRNASRECTTSERMCPGQ